MPWNDAWDDVLKTSIGPWIRHKRKTRAMQQQQLANVLGVSRRQVQRMESGEREPSMKVLVRMCEFFREMPPAHGRRLIELCTRLELLKVEDCCQRGEISNLKQETIEEEAAMERAFFERFDGLLARLDRIAGLLEARMSGAAGVARAAVPAPVAPVRPAPVAVRVPTPAAPTPPAAIRAPAPVAPLKVEEYPLPTYPPGEAPWDKVKVTVAGKLVQSAPEQAAPALEAVAASLAATASADPGAPPEAKVKKSRGRPKKAPEAPAPPPVNAKDVTPPLPFQDAEPDLSDKALVDAQRAALVAAMEKASGADLAKRYERAYGMPFTVGMTREFLVSAIVEALVNPKAVPPPPPAPANKEEAEDEEGEEEGEAGGDLDAAAEEVAQQAAPEGENLW